MTRGPDDGWLVQQLRETTPYGQGPRFLIRDNDNKYGAGFERVVEGTDIDVLTTPYEACQANAVCERFLGGVRRECLDLLPNPVRPHSQPESSPQDSEAIPSVLLSRALTRASTSVSPAPQRQYSATRERSSLTRSSVACIKITAGEQVVAAHWLALRECQPMAGFLPATTGCNRCKVQSNRSPRHLPALLGASACSLLDVHSEQQFCGPKVLQTAL